MVCPSITTNLRHCTFSRIIAALMSDSSANHTGHVRDNGWFCDCYASEFRSRRVTGAEEGTTNLILKTP